jgi:hypothetical protein
MENTRSKKNTSSKKSKKIEEQTAKTNVKEIVQSTAEDAINTNENTITANDINTLEDENIYHEPPMESSRTQSAVNPFALQMANKIMARIYAICGYTIEGDACKAIISQAQKYANAHNININTDIVAINTHELYDYIVSLISNGYNVSPLDDTYSDIFLRAIVERYKV